jgi:hypothetical protein
MHLQIISSMKRRIFYIFISSVLFFLVNYVSVAQIADENQSNNLQLRTLYGSTNRCNYITSGIFAVWWDKNYDYREGARNVLNSLINTRNNCLNIFGMKDPKGSEKFFYNVYIHNNGPDLFPDDWAQGQDTDKDGFPFLTIPVKLTSPDYHGHVHEGFHIFQYNANSPGLAYKGDSQWFIEATANWYVNIMYPDDIDGFICGQAVTAISQVPMWYSFDNKKPGDKNSWLRDDHQYGMNIYLYYLTEICKVSRYAIAHSFYDNITLLPQEYLYSLLGGPVMRKYFAEWAIHNAVGFDYLSSAQVERLKKEFQRYGDPDDDHSVVKTFNDEGTNGKWITVPEKETPGGWAYNVYKINNTISGNYGINIEGDEYGSNGTPSRFTVRAAVSKTGSNTFYSLDLTNDISGKLSLKVTPENTTIWIVIASTPDHFNSNQTYSYRLKIDREN